MPRQIAALICEDFGTICLEFDRIEEELYQTSNWTEHGATARMIVEFARQSDMGYVDCMARGSWKYTLARLAPSPYASPLTRNMRTSTEACTHGGSS